MATTSGSYIGPAALHDGVIERLLLDGDDLEVEVRGAEGERVRIRFRDVHNVREQEAIGSMLYGLRAEQKHSLRCRFVFVNWDEMKLTPLELDAADVEFR